MIYKLKSLSVMPPGGWDFFQPETGWRIPQPLNVDYPTAVKMIVNHRAANPAKGLSTDPEVVGQQLQNHIAHKIKFDAIYCVPVDEEAKKKAQNQGLIQKLVLGARRAVDDLRKTADGARVLMEWLGDGGEPVSRALALRRANTCATCPMNQQNRRRLSLPVVTAIKEHEGARKHLDLTTPQDAKLQMCGVCTCHLKLKVWVPLKFIRSTTDKEKFPPHCWVVREQEDRRTVVLRRRAAYGDVIQATAIATKLAEQGVDVVLECDEHIGRALKDHPDITEIRSITESEAQATPCTGANLDATYELHPERSVRHIKDLYVEAATPQLKALGLEIDANNWMPRLPVDQTLVEDVRKFMQLFPRPWIVVSPKSNAWYNRQVTFDVWAKVRPLVPGTMFWTGTDSCKAPIVDMGLRDFRRLIAAISLADVVVAVDSGPLHVAAALKKPLAAIPGPFRLDLRLTDQMDWTLARSTLSCIGCDHYKCHIPGRVKDPPCTTPEPELIAAAIHDRLLTLEAGRVSAIVPVFNPDTERLRKCLLAIKDQVQEMVVVIDGQDLPNLRTLLGPELVTVKIIHNPGGQQRGYGKTCNRGARQSNGSLLLMLNDDCFLNQGAVGQMREQMLPDVAVVGALLRYPDGKIQHGGTRPIGPLRWGHLDHRESVPSITQPVDMEFVTFAAALVRRSAFFQVGCFDERYFCYNEDSDLCLSLRRAGWRVRYNPNATGVHYESQSTGVNGKKMQMLQDGQRTMEKKWKDIL